MNDPAAQLTAHSYDYEVVVGDCVPRGDLAVLSTPAVVRLMEIAAMHALGRDLGQHEESVGMSIAISHLQPTLVGRTVTVTAEESARDGARHTFEVSVVEADKLVASGQHERFVVDKARFGRRLAKLAAASGDD